MSNKADIKEEVGGVGPELDTAGDRAPSKSQLKREMLARQVLGEKLTTLSAKRLNKIPLDDDLREAIDDYCRFKHREAKRRQLQFIGKLMREADIEAIEQAWDLTRAGSEAATQKLHKQERWRDRLLAEGNAAINDLLEAYPETDRQQLKNLIREAHKQEKENKPPMASRKIFQYLRQVMASE